MDDYARRGYGGTSVGFGQRVGIAVVDFQRAFIESRFALGGSALTERAVVNTATLLRAARAARLPVVSCYTAYNGPCRRAPLENPPRAGNPPPRQRGR